MNNDEPEVVIEDDVPYTPVSTIPPLNLERLEVGQCARVAIRTRNEEKALRQRVVRFQRSHPPKKFSARKVPGRPLMRVFRIEDENDEDHQPL